MKLNMNFKQLFENLPGKKFSAELSKKSGKFIGNTTALENVLRFTKIHFRLMTSFLVLTLLPLSFIGIMAHRKSSEAIESKIQTYSVQVMGQLSKNIQIELEKISSTIKEMSVSDTFQKDIPAYKQATGLDKAQLSNNTSSYLIKRLSTTPIITELDMYLDKDTYLGIGSLSSNLKAEAKDQLFKIAAEKEGDISWIMDSKINNRLVIAKEVKTLITRNTMGTILATVDNFKFYETYKGVDLGDGASIFIVDKNGVLISDKESSKIGTMYKSEGLISKIAGAENSRPFTFELDKHDYMVAFSKIENFDWYVVATIPYSYLTSESKLIGYSILWMVIACVIIALILSLVISRSISSPLKKLVELIGEAENGNLTFKLHDKSNDEIGEVIQKFNRMVFNISSLVSKVNTSARNVLENAEKITFSSGQSYSASEQIAITIHEISKGASEQALEVSEAVNHMNNLSNEINKVGNGVDVVSSTVSSTKTLSIQALQTVKSLNDKAMDTSNVSEKIVNEINSLNQDMKEIKKIVKVIVGIAEQTNLLSLNAAIEAARAGEAGKGFAVVAGEIKKLADQSKEALTTINSIINTIQNKTEHTVDAANSGNIIVKQQMEAVYETDSAFKTIFGTMESIASEMEGVKSSVNEMLISKNKTLEVIENISAVSEEAAATSEEVAASTQDRMSDSEQLSKLANNLNEMALELSKAISIFKTEKETGSL